jgi:protein-disulfide isomerase
MTNGESTDGPTTNNQRREDAREKAKILREQQRKKERRNRVLLQGGIAVVVVAIVAGVALILANSFRPAGPGPANMASDGIVIGKNLNAVTTPALQPGEAPIPSTPDPAGKVVDIQVYVDYLCPFCGDFDRTNTEQITQWLNSGAATVEFHPIAILTNQSAGTQYSLRAANATACVANYSPNSFYNFNTSLFIDQPQEGSPGLSNDELKTLVTSSGVESPAEVNKCIDNKTFQSFMKAATARALKGPIPNSTVEKITATPTILVNGKQYTGSLDDPQPFAAFVLAAASNPTPTTPEPTPTG